MKYLASRQPSQLLVPIGAQDDNKTRKQWSHNRRHIATISEAASLCPPGGFGISFSIWVAYKPDSEKRPGCYLVQRKLSRSSLIDVLPFEFSTNGQSVEAPLECIRAQMGEALSMADAWQAKNTNRVSDDSWMQARAVIDRARLLATAPYIGDGMYERELTNLLPVYYDDPEAELIPGAPASGAASRDLIAAHFAKGDALLVWALLANRLLRLPEFTTCRSAGLEEARESLKAIRCAFERDLGIA